MLDMEHRSNKKLFGHHADSYGPVDIGLLTAIGYRPACVIRSFLLDRS